MLLRDFISSSRTALSEIYPSVEAGNIVNMLLCDSLGLKAWEVALKYDLDLDTSIFERPLKRLLAGEPLQYVLGHCEFYSRRFKVDSRVLIPRPETELLVEWALELPLGKGARVLDLCTGSGAIAWSLALEKNDWQVLGVDISKDAIAVAKSQFDSPSSPGFICGDVLDSSFLSSLGEFDLVVSNPPYIIESEKSAMRKNVLDFEPSLALFVPDEDPLVFYKAIAQSCAFLLKKGGEGIVECNELFCDQTAELFQNSAFSEVKVLKDLSGKGRFVTFKRLLQSA